MPKKVFPGIFDFSAFESAMTECSFRRISGIEFKSDFKRLGLEAPKPRPGREVGFVFHANSLTVRVWTTWLSAERSIRDADSGWVLIVEGDEAVYFSHPVHRTKNFFLNLFRQAWIARWRVLHRPLCPECNQYMGIVRGRALKSRYWRCDIIGLHNDGKPKTLDWDYDLPPIAKKIVEKLRKKRQRTLHSEEKKGNTRRPAILYRRPWRKITV